jgi:hypothetical protein
MLYLIDSSAKNFIGHNLEYLQRISSLAKSDFVILGNKGLNPEENQRFHPTFEFGTWDFGRFGFLKRSSKQDSSKSSQTLRASKALITTERFVEIISAFVASHLHRLILFVTRFSKQSRSYHRDLTQSLTKMSDQSILIISTANARELVGLNQWIKHSTPNRYPISVILRLPILDLRSFLEIPLLLIDALVYLSAIKKLAQKVKFYADTPGLAAKISAHSGEVIRFIPAMGFKQERNNLKGLIEVAVAPNSRVETRYVDEGLSSVTDLSSSVKGEIDSSSYRQLLLSTRSMILPYDPLRYRFRSSGVFAELLTLGIFPIVPTGTSMSREVTDLNSKILSRPEFVAELKVGSEMDLRQFDEEDLIITLEANFAGSIVLDISDKLSENRKFAFDFFESGSKDSFLYYGTKQGLFSFKTDRFFFSANTGLKISVNRIPPTLFGACYLEGDIHSTISGVKKIDFHDQNSSLIRDHSPESICERLGI